MNNKIAKDIIERLQQALSSSLSELADEKMEIRQQYEIGSKSKEDFEWCEIDKVQDFINDTSFKLDKLFANVSLNETEERK